VKDLNNLTFRHYNFTIRCRRAPSGNRTSAVKQVASRLTD